MGNKPAGLLVLCYLLNLTNGVTEYYVSLEGDDANPGTIEKPWRHVQTAVGKLEPGDRCIIRAGRYTEEVTIDNLQGAPGNPITFESYHGEQVVLDGTVVISGQSWTRYKDNVYKTTLENDIWQLFVDGEMQVNARWPNAHWSDFSVFDYTKWGFSSPDSTYDHSSATGVMVDNGTSLGDSGLNATEAVAILNIGSWKTWAGLVDGHEPGSNSFKYHLESVPNGVHFDAANCRYYLEDKLDFLDTPTEWFYDKETRQLYLWTASGDSPGSHEIRGKVSTYAYTVTGGSAWLVFANLSFFGTTVFIKGQSHKEDVHDVVLRSLHFTYPSYTRRMLGSLSLPNTTTIYYTGPLTPNAGNYTIFNCTWEYADGQAISYRGADGMIENNLWCHNDFSCVGNGNVFDSEGVRDNFTRNVIHSNGPSVGFSPGASTYKDGPQGQPRGSTVRLNLFYDLKYLQNDGSHIQVKVPSQEEISLEYNWGYDTLKYGLRFDCVDFNVTRASCGHNGTMYNNVMWGTQGVAIKGDYHSFYSNLVFNGVSYTDLFLRGYPSSDAFEGENTHTVTVRNVMQHGACSARTKTKCTFPVPGVYEENTVGDVHEYLRDPENFDFRPKPGSSLVSSGIGPYGSESMAHGGTYWIPGRLELRASSPIPPNATTTAKCNADLMWLAGYQAEEHSVYFGTDAASVATADPTSPYFLGKLEVPANIVTPSNGLKPATKYFWRVDVGVAGDVRRGDTWWFQCA